jgi:tRNA(fMet)-specific endonuclease VapC
MYLLDSNTLIYFFKQQGKVTERLRAKTAAQIKLPAPALFELEFGTAKSRKSEAQRQQINDVLRVFELVPLDYASARAAGQLRHQLESAGQPIGTIDTLIAGIALANQLTVVTRNVREFSLVPGLTVENWYD